MNKNNFLLEWYYKEVERKNHLENSLNIPIGVLTALIAGIYYLVVNFNYSVENILVKWIFLFAIILTMFFWIKSIYFAFKSYSNFRSGYEYKDFPNANFIRDEEINCKKFYDENKNDLDADVTVAKLVEDNIEEVLSTCVNNYIENNDKKTAELLKCKVHLLYCIITIFGSLIFFGINYIKHEKENIYKIEIMSDKKPQKPPVAQQPRTVKQSKTPRAVPNNIPNPKKK